MTEKGIKIGIETSTFDNQALEWWKSCPMFYYYRIVKGVVKVADKKDAANFGSLIHMALEHYYREGMTDESINDSLDLFTKEYIKYGISPDDDKRNLMKGLEILSNYFQKYRHEPFNVVGTEIGGAIDLKGILYTFRIDLVDERITPKGIEGMDHKTTSSLGRLIAKPANQLTGYYKALVETYENVSGFIMNLIGVYKSDKMRDKATGKMVPREIFDRIHTSRTSLELDLWVKETIQTVHLIESCHESGVWPRHAPSYCTAYRGRCMYLDLCLAQDSEQILEALLAADIYRLDPWQPYKSDEGEGGEEE